MQFSFYAEQGKSFSIFLMAWTAYFLFNQNSPTHVQGKKSFLIKFVPCCCKINEFEELLLFTSSFRHNFSGEQPEVDGQLS